MKICTIIGARPQFVKAAVGKTSWDEALNAGKKKSYLCPSDDSGATRTYTMNGYYKCNGSNGESGISYRSKSVTTTAVNVPTETIIFAEFAHKVNMIGDTAKRKIKRRSLYPGCIDTIRNKTAGFGLIDGKQAIHGSDHANFAFVDGHVATKTYAETFKMLKAGPHGAGSIRPRKTYLPYWQYKK